MPHLIEPMFVVSYAAAIQQLENAHIFLVQRAREAITTSSISASTWGIEFKRLMVDLATVNCPAMIVKQNERFGEVVNMAATIERLIPALKWFYQNLDFKHLRVKECHPSTSGEERGNDLVLVSHSGRVVVRCEVCDVASDRAGSNRKEKKDIRNLYCDGGVSQDGIDRFICTVREFAQALTSPKRKWSGYDYQYDLIELGNAADTCLLKIIPGPAMGTD